MLHLWHLLKSFLYTALIAGIPVLVITGGTMPERVLHHPAYQFFVLLVFAYTAAPVISDFAGNHVGKSIFFPNRANLDHPTMSHIITLRNKRLYKEALEELRMLTDLHPHEIEPYKMLLHLTAHELPDRRLFDMFFRKGMFNLETDELKEKFKRYREEHIQYKDKEEEEWRECSHEETKEPEHHERHFFANHTHIKAKSKILVDSTHGTLPPKNKAVEKKPKKKVLLPAYLQEAYDETGTTPHFAGNDDTPKTNPFIEKHKSRMNIISHDAGEEIEPEKPREMVNYVFKRKRK